MHVTRHVAGQSIMQLITWKQSGINEQKLADHVIDHVISRAIHNVTIHVANQAIEDAINLVTNCKWSGNQSCDKSYKQRGK